MTDLERLQKLHDEYNKQRNRMVKMLDVDFKSIGTTKVARNLKINISYLYKVTNGYGISHDAFVELYNKTQELKRGMGVS